MTSTRQIVDSYYLYLKNRDREKLIGLLSNEIVVTYHAQNGQFPWAGQFHGIQGFDQFFTKIKEYLDVIEVTIIDSIADDSKVVNLCEGSWKYKASGYIVTGSMVNVFTVENGKIFGYDVYADTAAFAAGFTG